MRGVRTIRVKAQADDTFFSYVKEGDFAAVMDSQTGTEFVSPVAATRKLLAISPLLEFAALRKSRPCIAYVLRNGRVIRTQDEMAAYIGSVIGFSRSTIWLWVKRYHDRGLPGLIDRARSDRGISRAFSTQPTLATLAKRLMREGEMSARAIHRRLVQEFPSCAPSYATVLAFTKSERAKARARRRAS